MPGILSKSESAIKAPEESKAVTTVSSRKTAALNVPDINMEDISNSAVHLNGQVESVNKIHVNGVAAIPPASQQNTTTAVNNFVGQLPPEIQHITFGYVSFPNLVRRLVQHTFNGLTNVLTQMSEMPALQPAPNGLHSHMAPRVNGNAPSASSQANVDKKLRLLNFAHDRRAQFMKILVLSQWARQAEAVGRVIDLKVWLDSKRDEHRSAVNWMGQLKRLLVDVKESNPDIKTALRVLSLSKASWLPNLGYLPPEPLSPKQQIDGLRRINTLLSIRLNLHEIIPPVFRDYSISSGRATFRVIDEFKVDLSIADEDPASQLYFIDFRFYFFPAPPELPVGRLRNELEGRANDVLKREGLQGLFDFLHNLVLTHKLSVLRNQAYDMARGYWSEQLKVEPVRRSTVVQYWCNRPGGKNWIEIGIRKGKEIRVPNSQNVQRISNIALRWFRHGKEVANVQVQMRLGYLSLAEILKQIIALHTSYVFTEIATKLRENLLYSSGLLRIRNVTSTTEPLDASLLVQITTAKAIKVVQESVSGRFAILPASELNSRAEFELNRLVSPAAEGAFQIGHLRSFASQGEVDVNAQCVGWESVQPLRPGQEAMQRLFPKTTRQIKFFRRQTWSSNWVLAFTTSLEGDFFWVVELADKKTESGAAASGSMASSVLLAAYKIVSTDSKRLIIESSFATLARIERCAAGMISQYNDTRHLAALKIPHRVQVSSAASTGTPAMTTYLRFPGKRAPPIVRSPNPLTLPWTNEIIKLDYRGLDASNTFAIHVASARMQKPIAKIKDLTSTISSIAFHPTSGAFAFHLLTRVGETSVPALTHRLSAIERLLNFISTIKTYNLIFEKASLTHLDFIYEKRPTPLKATIHFPIDTPMHLSLSSPNPHLRILDHLTARLRSQGLVPVIGILRMTHPLLRGLDTIESAEFQVFARSEQRYQIGHSSPSQKKAFDICLRMRRDDPKWFIDEATINGGEPLGDKEEWERALKVVTRGRGKDWRGMKGGIVAGINGIEEVLVKLHSIFANAKHAPGKSGPRKRKAEEEIVEID